MTTLNLKNLLSKSQSKQPDLHIPGVAGAIFVLFMILGGVGAIVTTSRGWPEFWAPVFIIGATLIGIFFLFSLKIASPW